MIDETRKNAALVADLMQVAIAAPDRSLRDLPDQRQHRGVGAVRGEEAGRRVEQARARHHAIGLWFSSRERGAKRHQARALLMPGMDCVDAIGGLEQCVEERIVVHARQRIDGVEAVRDQRCDDCLRGGHDRHQDGAPDPCCVVPAAVARIERQRNPGAFSTFQARAKILVLDATNAPRSKLSGSRTRVDETMRDAKQAHHLLR
jgi:hypothetical protein